MKKTLLSLLVGIYSVLFGYAQQQSNLASPKEEEQPVFQDVEVMPQFPGGFSSLSQFLAANLNYPEDAQNAGAQGTVFVSFVVSKTGDIIDVTLLKGIGYGCDEEAVRVVKLMPHWMPGKQDGRNVSVRYSLPIKFAITE